MQKAWKQPTQRGAKVGIQFEKKWGGTTWTRKTHNEKEGKREALKQKLADTENDLLTTSAKRDYGEKAKGVIIDVDCGVEVCKSCRYRQELSNDPKSKLSNDPKSYLVLLAKVGFDTAENKRLQSFDVIHFIFSIHSLQA